MQSPIALESASAAPRAAHVSTSYHHMSSVTLSDIQWTVSAAVEPGGVIDLDGQQFVLEEVHGHAPAEHTIDGYRADLEVHLVHRGSDDQLAGLAVLFDAVPGKRPVDAYIGKPGDPPTIERVDLIVPRDSTAFRYLGSRTAPPYTPGVLWVVFTQRFEVGEEALRVFAEGYAPNIRELQDSSATTVTLG